MNGLREKFRNKKGFTLIEMLIVVAIIAILIAVSIPLVSNALEKTKHATDAANERAAKAEFMVQYLSDADATIDGAKGKISIDTAYFYDAPNGSLVTTGPKVSKAYGQHGDHVNKYLAIGINDKGEVKMIWTTSNGGTAFTNLTNTGLCSNQEVNHS